MVSWWAEGSQPRNSLGHHVPFGWGLRGARVSMEAGPLTLAVGEVEVDYRSHRQLSKPRSGGWEAAELGNRERGGGKAWSPWMLGKVSGGERVPRGTGKAGPNPAHLASCRARLGPGDTAEDKSSRCPHGSYCPPPRVAQ